MTGRTFSRPTACPVMKASHAVSITRISRWSDTKSAGNDCSDIDHLIPIRKSWTCSPLLSFPLQFATPVHFAPIRLHYAQAASYEKMPNDQQSPLFFLPIAAFVTFPSVVH